MGLAVGLTLGLGVGLILGLAVGFTVGLTLGLAVGFTVGLTLGLAVGFTAVGFAVGFTDGSAANVGKAAAVKPKERKAERQMAFRLEMFMGYWEIK